MRKLNSIETATVKGGPDFSVLLGGGGIKGSVQKGNVYKLIKFHEEANND